jgi:hypothetical protein
MDTNSWFPPLWDWELLFIYINNWRTANEITKKIVAVRLEYNLAVTIFCIIIAEFWTKECL